MNNDTLNHHARCVLERAAQTILDRAESHYRAGDHKMQDECLRCASVIRDLKPERATEAGTPAKGGSVAGTAVKMPDVTRMVPNLLPGGRLETHIKIAHDGMGVVYYKEHVAAMQAYGAARAEEARREGYREGMAAGAEKTAATYSEYIMRTAAAQRTAGGDAVKIDCASCLATGINGWTGCSDCNGKGFHWEPVAEAAAQADDKWRKLALQFDGQRMQALWHLKAMLQDPEKHRPQVEAFLAAAPTAQPTPLEQAVRRTLDNSAEDAQTGEIAIARANYEALCTLLGMEFEHRDEMAAQPTSPDDELRSALSALLKRYGDLAGSGDAGNWDWEAEEVVVSARAALRQPGALPGEVIRKLLDLLTAHRTAGTDVIASRYASAILDLVNPAGAVCQPQGDEQPQFFQQGAMIFPNACIGVDPKELPKQLSMMIFALRREEARHEETKASLAAIEAQGDAARDDLTSKAMQGILANPVYFAELQDAAVEQRNLGHTGTVFWLVASLAQDMADEMIAARKRHAADAAAKQAGKEGTA